MINIDQEDLKIPFYQVDAFARNPFKGNPAAVCPLEEWLPDKMMQDIAMENNLSETAFFVPEQNGYRLRWFTPASEVDLCGHATLATAHVLFKHMNVSAEQVSFHTKSGMLVVSRGENDILNMDFPANHAREMPNDPDYGKIFGIQPVAAFRTEKLMLLYPDESAVRAVSPDFREVGKLDAVGVIITAKGETYDFVSRFFAPAVGIDEDPVTGSAHCSLIPFWHERLKKTEMTAFQCSARGGILYCRDNGDRVIIGGNAVTFSEGSITV